MSRQSPTTVVENPWVGHFVWDATYRVFLPRLCRQVSIDFDRPLDQGCIRQKPSAKGGFQTWQRSADLEYIYLRAADLAFEDACTYLHDPCTSGFYAVPV